MTELPPEIDRFVRIVENSLDFNLPRIALNEGLDWKEIKEHILGNPDVKDRLAQALDVVRWEMLAGVLKVAKEGKDKSSGKSADLAFVKEAVRLIDQGVLLGGKMQAEHKGGTDAETAAILRQLTGKRQGED